MPKRRPLITLSHHMLPFSSLSPEQFERLCLWLVEAEGYEQAEHYGLAGQDGGRDIVARRNGDLVIFQCKRVERLTPKAAVIEVEKLLAQTGAQRPVTVVFLVSTAVSASAREQAKAKAKDLKCEFWAGSELDLRVKKHPELLEEFFTRGTRAKGFQVRTAHGSQLINAEHVTVKNYFQDSSPESHVTQVVAGNPPQVQQTGTDHHAPLLDPEVNFYRYGPGVSERQILKNKGTVYSGDSIRAQVTALSDSFLTAILYDSLGAASALELFDHNRVRRNPLFLQAEQPQMIPSSSDGWALDQNPGMEIFLLLLTKRPPEKNLIDQFLFKISQAKIRGIQGTSPLPPSKDEIALLLGNTIKTLFYPSRNEVTILSIQLNHI